MPRVQRRLLRIAQQRTEAPRLFAVLGEGGVVRGGFGVEGVEGLEEGFWGFVGCREDGSGDQGGGQG